MCCSLSTFGYKSDWQRNMVQTTSTCIAFAAITGVAIGVFSLYGVLSSSTGLWVQVGLFGGVAALTGATVAVSSKVKSKFAVIMAVISLLALPVLFGSLGAMGIIPPIHMLWAATAMCGAVVVGSFAVSACAIGRDCCDSR